MARNYVDIGPSPSEEDCVQVGVDNYTILSRKECNRFISLIREVLGEEPLGAELKIKGNSHDFGTYYSVVCYYDEDSEEASDYAYKVEEHSPSRWNI